MSSATMDVAGDGCDAEGVVAVVALFTGETLVLVPVEDSAGKTGAIAEVDTVTVKADEDEEISAVVTADEDEEISAVVTADEDEEISAVVTADVLLVDAGFVEKVEEVEEGAVVSIVDPGMTLAVAVVVVGSSVTGTSTVPVLMINVFVWHNKAW
ncbi:patatin-like phospholipase domain-containing protein [Physcia stellaris]|nr:patatin-like phospholipase domain-containing protein [Physcia stellaris]